MSISKTQQFLYFQNKARHYQNIRKAKPCVNDQLNKQYRNTINYSSSSKKNNRRQPYLKMYNIHVYNQHLISRLVNIAKSQRTQVQVQGTYSRFNKVERQFRKKNPHKDETERKIALQNEEMINRIDQAKPAIGSTTEWLVDQQKRLSLRKNMSRYDDSQTSKGSLHLSTDRFLPQHYKSFIFTLQGENEGKGRTVLTKKKLTKLPKILYSNRSNSVLQ